MARDDMGEAVALARRAHRMKPDSEWVSQSLFELQTRSGQWLDAGVTVREAARNKHLTHENSRRRQAVLSYQLSMNAESSGDHAEALKQARAAVDLDATLVPAVLGVARSWIKTGRLRKAASMIEKAWGRTPHPDLVILYSDSRAAKNLLEVVKAVERLAGFNPGHVESNLAVARAALDADLWGQARTHLDAIHENDQSARVCRMMAELEEAEHNDLASSRKWLVQASIADPDPAYVCGDCGNTVRNWHATCDNCNGFDRYEWRVPPHAVRVDKLLPDVEPIDAIEIEDDDSVTLIEHNSTDIIDTQIKPFSAEK